MYSIIVLINNKKYYLNLETLKLENNYNNCSYDIQKIDSYTCEINEEKILNLFNVDETSIKIENISTLEILKPIFSDKKWGKIVSHIKDGDLFDKSNDEYISSMIQDLENFILNEESLLIDVYEKYKKINQLEKIDYLKLYIYRFLTVNKEYNKTNESNNKFFLSIILSEYIEKINIFLRDYNCMRYLYLLRKDNKDKKKFIRL